MAAAWREPTRFDQNARPLHVPRIKKPSIAVVRPFGRGLIARAASHHYAAMIVQGSNRMRCARRGQIGRSVTEWYREPAPSSRVTEPELRLDTIADWHGRDLAGTSKRRCLVCSDLFLLLDVRTGSKTQMSSCVHMHRVAVVIADCHMVPVSVNLKAFKPHLLCPQRSYRKDTAERSLSGLFNTTIASLVVVY